MPNIKNQKKGPTTNIAKKQILSNDVILKEETTRNEIVFKKTATKITYYFIDKKKGINQLSKDEFLKTDKVIHYPISYKGGSKYKNIQCIEFIGFSKLSKNPPVGVHKSANYGYGFTKHLRHFATYLDKHLEIKKVIIEKDCTSKYEMKQKIIWFNQDNLSKIKKIFESLEAEHDRESIEQATIELNHIFPKEIKSNIATYKPDSIFRSLRRWNNSINDFTERDKSAINELFEKLSLTNDFLSNDSLIKHKEIIDTKYIESCYNDYSRLLKNTKDTPALEKKWQNFIKEKSWIFTYIFSQPIILYKDEAFVGGKNIDNKGGKIVDFLGKNNITNNISFLEIKTHKTILINNKPYRGSDVFCVSDELSGAINQVLRQRDTLQKSYATLFISGNKDYKTFNSTCIVLIGSISDLTEKQQECFELFRSNSKDVDIITFDELLEKIKLFQNLMKRKSKNV
jgi:hypothetical protein